jgi:hypothetical protein
VIARRVAAGRRKESCDTEVRQGCLWAIP